MPDSLDAWLARDLWGIPFRAWLIALAVSLASAGALLFFRRLVITRWKAIAERTETKIDDFLVAVISRTSAPLLLGAALAIGALTLNLTEGVRRWVALALTALVIVQVGAWFSWLVRLYVEHRFGEGADEDPSKRTGMAILRIMAQTAVWSLVALLLLDQVGVDITALIAGLGVVGIAVGLALQSVLGDLFASVSILLDKPFVVGDFIIVGDFSGTVEEIGIKTVRVRGLGGEQVIFANNDLLQSRLRNFKSMQERRILFQIGIVYETPVDKVEAVPAIIREIIEATENTRFDRAHFIRYGDFALVFEVVYYVQGNEFVTYADAQQKINLEIFRRLQAQGIDFAYPTQTLLLRQESPAS